MDNNRMSNELIESRIFSLHLQICLDVNEMKKKMKNKRRKTCVMRKSVEYVVIFYCHEVHFSFIIATFSLILHWVYKKHRKMLR